MIPCLGSEEGQLPQHLYMLFPSVKAKRRRLAASRPPPWRNAQLPPLPSCGSKAQRVEGHHQITVSLLAMRAV